MDMPTTHLLSIIDDAPPPPRPARFSTFVFIRFIANCRSEFPCEIQIILEQNECRIMNRNKIF